MTIVDHYKISTAESLGNFVNFVKINTEDLNPEDLNSDINHLSKKIAMNMFYYPDNISTAKSDYISLIGLLIKKGVILEEFKDLVPDTTYPY